MSSLHLVEEMTLECFSWKFVCYLLESITMPCQTRVKYGSRCRDQSEHRLSICFEQIKTRAKFKWAKKPRIEHPLSSGFLWSKGHSKWPIRPWWATLISVPGPSCNKFRRNCTRSGAWTHPFVLCLSYCVYPQLRSLLTDKYSVPLM